MSCVEDGRAVCAETAQTPKVGAMQLRPSSYKTQVPTGGNWRGNKSAAIAVVTDAPMLVSITEESHESHSSANIEQAPPRKTIRKHHDNSRGSGSGHRGSGVVR